MPCRADPIGQRVVRFRFRFEVRKRLTCHGPVFCSSIREVHLNFAQISRSEQIAKFGRIFALQESVQVSSGSSASISASSKCPERRQSSRLTHLSVLPPHS